MLNLSREAAKRWSLTIVLCILVLPFTLVVGRFQNYLAEPRNAVSAEEGARLRAGREAEEAREAAARLKAERDEAFAKFRGDHCISRWDGSVPGVVNAVKARLRDPNSFEHVNTMVSGRDAKGKHRVIMTYRAKNGFGGLNNGMVEAEVDGETCAAKLTGTME